MPEIKKNPSIPSIADRFTAFLPVFCGILAWILYESTNTDGFFWGDAEEFTAAANTLGIGHPYGHPLFWLVGRASILFNSINPAGAMNHMTAFFSALTCIVVALIVKQCLPKTTNPLTRILTTLTVTTLYTTSTTVWTQATFTEVYNFQAFFISLSIYFFLLYVDENKNISFAFASIYCFGIALTLGYYIIIILLLPILSFKKLISRRFFRFRNILIGALFFLLSLSIYLYLPIRSFLSPSFAMNQIDSIASFINYISRTRYQASGTAGILYFGISILEACKILFANMGIFGFLFLLVYIVGVIRDRSDKTYLPYFLTALFISFLFSLIIPLNLNLRQMVDMDVYLIPFLILIIPPLTIGTSRFLSLLRNQLKPLILIPLILVSVFRAPSISIANKKTSSLFSSFLLTSIPEQYLVIPVSDEIAHSLFYLIFSENNSKHLRLPDFKLGSKEICNTASTIHDSILIEINDFFLDQFICDKEYHVAGPFLVPPQDSLTAINIESRFAQQFSPENMDLNRLNRLDRLSLARIWSRRGVYWFHLFKKFREDSIRSETVFKNTIQSFNNAFLLDNFTFESISHANNLASVFAQAKDWNHAEYFAEKAIQMDRNSEIAIRILFTVANERKDYPNALHYLRRLSRLKPDNSEIHLDISVFYYLLNQPEKAEKEYLKGIRLGANKREKLETLLF